MTGWRNQKNGGHLNTDHLILRRQIYHTILRHCARSQGVIHWQNARIGVGGGGGGGDSGRLPFMQSKNACDNDVDYNVARPVLRVTIVEDVVGWITMFSSQPKSK